jgi:hypothetical protein
VEYYAPEKLWHGTADFEKNDPRLITLAARKSWDVYALGMTFYDLAWGSGEEQNRKLDPYACNPETLDVWERTVLQIPPESEESTESVVLNRRLANEDPRKLRSDKRRQGNRFPSYPYWPALNDQRIGDTSLNLILFSMLRLKDDDRATINTVVDKLQIAFMPRLLAALVPQRAPPAPPPATTTTTGATSSTSATAATSSTIPR